MAIADLYVPPVISQIVDTEPGGREPEISLGGLSREIDRTVLLASQVEARQPQRMCSCITMLSTQSRFRFW